MTPTQVDADTAKMIRNIVRDDAKRRAERFGYLASLERLEQLTAERERVKVTLPKVDDVCGF